MYTHIFKFFEKCIIFFIIFIGTGLLAEKPSLEYVPNSSLIWYRVGQRNTTSYITEVETFLKPYYKQLNENDDTIVNLRYIQPCTKDLGYGFVSVPTGPCIFFKLTNIHGWVPQTYNSTTIELSNLPSHLKEYALAQYYRHNKNNQFILLDCKGEYSADVENIGPLVYFPARGFSMKHFPLKDTDLSPIVMIFFEKPKYGVLISVVCKAWAPNFSTSVRIQLLVDY